LIHVEGAAVEGAEPENKKVHEHHQILTPHATVVSDIKNVIKTIILIEESDFFAVHYLGSQVHAIFAIVVHADTSVRVAQEIAKIAREKVLQELPYLSEVTIKLELTKKST